MRKEYLKQALFIYSFTSIPRNRFNIDVKVIWHLNNSSWFSSNTFLCHRKCIKVVFWSKSHDKWKIHLGSFQLFLRFEEKTHSSYRDQRHMSKRWYQVPLFNNFATSRQNTELSMWSKSHRIWKFRADSISLFSDLQRKICSWYLGHCYVHNE